MVRPSWANNCGADQSRDSPTILWNDSRGLETYYPQAATSDVDSGCLPGKTAADDNSIGLEFRVVVLLPVFHKAFELLTRRAEGAGHSIGNPTTM